VAAGPRDLDLAVIFEYAEPRDALGLRDGLVELTDYEGIDLGCSTALDP